MASSLEAKEHMPGNEQMVTSVSGGFSVSTLLGVFLHCKVRWLDACLKPVAFIPLSIGRKVALGRQRTGTDFNTSTVTPHCGVCVCV